MNSRFMFAAIRYSRLLQALWSAKSHSCIQRQQTESGEQTELGIMKTIIALRFSARRALGDAANMHKIHFY